MRSGIKPYVPNFDTTGMKTVLDSSDKLELERPCKSLEKNIKVTTDLCGSLKVLNTGSKTRCDWSWAISIDDHWIE